MRLCTVKYKSMNAEHSRSRTCRISRDSSSQDGWGSCSADATLVFHGSARYFRFEDYASLTLRTSSSNEDSLLTKSYGTGGTLARNIRVLVSLSWVVSLFVTSAPPGHEFSLLHLEVCNNGKTVSPLLQASPRPRSPALVRCESTDKET